jgi:hypothetical protein
MGRRDAGARADGGDILAARESSSKTETRACTFQLQQFRRDVIAAPIKRGRLDRCPLFHACDSLNTPPPTVATPGGRERSERSRARGGGLLGGRPVPSRDVNRLRVSRPPDSRGGDGGRMHSHTPATGVMSPALPRRAAATRRPRRPGKSPRKGPAGAAGPGCTRLPGRNGLDHTGTTALVRRARARITRADPSRAGPSGPGTRRCRWG